MIKIWVKDGWWFKFHSLEEGVYMYHTKRCPYCKNMFLDPIYCYIIDSLKKADLLDKNFEEICCSCVILRYFGLIHIVKDLKEFGYEKDNDVLTIEFWIWAENWEINEEKVIEIRIHDWSKIELF